MLLQSTAADLARGLPFTTTWWCRIAQAAKWNIGSGHPATSQGSTWLSRRHCYGAAGAHALSVVHLMHDLSKTFYRITSAAGLFFTASRNSACKDSPVAMGKEVHFTQTHHVGSNSATS